MRHRAAMRAGDRGRTAARIDAAEANQPRISIYAFRQFAICARKVEVGRRERTHDGALDRVGVMIARRRCAVRAGP